MEDSIVDENEEVVERLRKKLRLLHSYDTIQTTILSDLARSIFDRTEIDHIHFKKSAITKFFKEKWKVNTVKRNKKVIKAYFKTEKPVKVLTKETFDEKTIDFQKNK